MPHSLRRQRKIVAALKLPRPESVQPEIEERGGSIQKARRTRLSSATLSKIQTAVMTCLHCRVSSYISYRVGASLHVHVSTTCFILHAAYFILHVHVPKITCLLLRTCLYLYISCLRILCSWIAPARQQCHAFS